MNENTGTNRVFRGLFFAPLIFLTTCSLFNKDDSSSTGPNLDTTFGTGGIVTTAVGISSGSADSVAIQSDGKIVAAGGSWDDTSHGLTLMRYNTDGSLDTTFGTEGIVSTVVGTISGIPYSVAIQPDDKIVVAGPGSIGFALVRYNTNGSLDTTFGTGGIVTTAIGTPSGFPYSIAIQPDGKIVVAGYSWNGTNDAIALVRYNTDGSLDTTFGTGGLVTTAVGTSSFAHSIAIQSDGKIVAAGFSWNGTNDTIAMVRYNTDGSLDTAFGTGGMVTITVGEISYIQGIAFQSDDKIVALAVSWTGTNKVFVLVRYNIDGSLDTAFGTSGIVTTSIGAGNDYLESIAIQADDKIVAAGYSFGLASDFTLVRYNTDGSPDTTFGTGGIVTTALGTSSSYAYSVAIQSDGKIIAVGYSGINTSITFALVRYNTDGSLDTTFGTGGMVAPVMVTGNDFTKSIVLQPDGKIVAGGYAYNGTNFDFALARYNTDGSLDTTFGTGGIVTTDTGEGNDYLQSIVLQPNGKIVAAGYTYNNGANSDFVLVRYNTDGSLDTTFNNTGIVIPIYKIFSKIYSVAIQPDGKIVAAGSALSDPIFLLVRHNSDGSLDTTFGGGVFPGVGGLVATPIGQPSSALSVAIQSDGKIVAAGYTHNYNGTNDDFALVRYNTDGSLDTTFNAAGIVTIAMGAGDDRIQSVAIQSDGKIVAAGYTSTGTNTTFAIVRYNIDGSVDPTFGTGGKITTAIGTSGSVNSVAIDSTGKIVVAGFTNNGKKSDFAVARYNPDGLLGKIFRPGEIVTTAIGVGDDVANSVVIQSDGKIIAAGSTYNGTNTDFALTRYLP